MPRLAIIIPEPTLLKLMDLNARLLELAKTPHSNGKIVPQMEEACALEGYTYITYWRRRNDYERDHQPERRSGGDRRDRERPEENRRSRKDRRKSN